VWYAIADRIEDKLPRVQSPALVVIGTLDGFTPVSWAEELAGLLPHGRLAVVEGAPHTLNYSRPAELARLALPLIREEWPAPEGG
jgi:pimeloyl-ACP methyl ester carboxylesterase